MNKRLYTAAALVVTPAMVAATGIAGPGFAQTPHRPHVVSVIGDGSHVHVNHPVLHAGKITFRVRSTASNDHGGSAISLFRPKRGHTLSQVFSDLAEEFSPDPATAAKGTRDLVRDVVTYGLADVSSARGARVTRTLGPGTYYLMDLGTTPTSGPPATTRLTVLRHGGYRAAADTARPRATVQVTSADRFRVHGTLPATGTIRVSNVSDTLHFMLFLRVKPGTTDKQIQDSFASGSGSGGPPPYEISSPQMGIDVLTPGQSLQFSYRLHPGTYALACFIADDKTGAPHFFMGMHKVVRLR